MEAAGGDHHHLHQEEVIIGCKEQHNNIVIKGKRTKRSRPQSPIPFAIPTTSSSPEDGGGGSSRGGGENDYINSATNLSPTTSAEFQDSTTEEEEDMANCLILLAQGQSRAASSSPNHHHHHQPHNDHNTTSRRFLEATTGVGTTAAKPGAVAARGGYCVYECKTCNRTFPSFQALGGHRASHKKPKANIGDDQKNKHFAIGLLPSDEEDTQLFKNKIRHTSTSSSPLSLHLSNRGLVLSSNKSSSKVHECSTCGAEFTSGQALGGHMRRHRAPAAANTTLALTAPSVPAFEPQQHQNQHQHQQQQQPIKKQRSMLSLDLDLNLPAPEDDHQREPKFVSATSKQQQQQQQQQQQPERLRTQILVDCHY